MAAKLHALGFGNELLTPVHLNPYRDTLWFASSIALKHFVKPDGKGTESDAVLSKIRSLQCLHTNAQDFSDPNMPCGLEAVGRNAEP